MEDTYGIRFSQNQKGSVVIFIALIISVLVLVAGLAMDTARSQLIRSKLQATADSTALALGSELNSRLLTPDQLSTRAQQLFNATFPVNYLEVETPVVTASLDGASGVITLAATVQLPTTLMQFVGQNQVTIDVTSKVLHSVAVPTEVVLALDVTGSMVLPLNSTESKYLGLYQASTDFVSQLSTVNTSNGTNDIYVGVVPYTQTVNIGVSGVSSVPVGFQSYAPPTWNTGNSWLDSNDPALNYDWADSVNTTAINENGTPYSTPLNHIGAVPPFGWGGCVMARASATPSPSNSALTLDLSDDPPSVAPFQRFYYPNDNNQSATTLLNCAECTSFKSANGGTGTVGEGGTVPIIGSCQSSYTGNNPWNCQLPADTGPSYFINDSYTNNTNPTFNQGSMWYIPQLSGPNYTCPILGTIPNNNNQWGQPFSIFSLQLAQDQGLSTMIQNIASLNSNPNFSNGTTIDIGLAWAWRLLSPKWAGLWQDGVDAPTVNWRAKPPANLLRYIVLMTDGVNNTVSSSTMNGILGNYAYTAYGLTAPDGTNFGVNPSKPITSVSGSPPPLSTAQLDAKTLQLCSAVKASGITLYTIGFGTTADVNVNLLTACASPGDFVLATDNDALAAAFSKIASDIISNIRVIK